MFSKESIGVCFSNPCLNNGYCLDHGKNFSCLCNENYYGTACEIIKKKYSFSEWSEWTTCSKSCLKGFMQRKKLCKEHHSKKSVSRNFCNSSVSFHQISLCNHGKCPFFKTWSDWTLCENTCLNNRQISIRSCSKKAFDSLDWFCKGPIKKEKHCKKRNCNGNKCNFSYFYVKKKI